MTFFQLGLGSVLGAVFWGCAAHAAAPLASEVTLSSGTVRAPARDARGVLAFKGIPYAAPPVGERRWRPPGPVAAWHGVLDASHFGSPCSDALGMSENPKEDCLTVNVWTSARSRDERRPVMVWIHGGGFQGGSSNWPATDGALLAAKGVVLVSFNYRLGVFGFLAHPTLDREGSQSRNFGLQDQIAALKWVRDNIVRFGGDAGNVTIFGESAGSSSVGLLMTSPPARGLFHKAIGESGAFGETHHGSLPSRAEAEAHGRALADRLAHGSIAELRAVSAETLSHETAWTISVDPLTGGFYPSIDGIVVPEDPGQTFARGRQADVPLLAGFNSAEGFAFDPMTMPHANPAQFRASVTTWLGEANMAEFLKLYPAGTVAETQVSAQTLAGDTIIGEQAWEWRRLHRESAKSPVYGYYFSLRTPYTPIPTHGVEVPYVFGTLVPHRVPGGQPEARDREVSEQMMSYWTNFARAANPNGSGLPPWPAYQTEAPRVMVFDATTTAGPEVGAERYRFIQAFRKNGRFPDSWRAAP